MLRKTAARAFAGADEPSAKMPKAASETRRAAAVTRLFVDLHATLRERLSSSPSSTPRAHTAESEASPAELTDPHSHPQGVEFELRGANCRLRFRDTMSGAIEVTSDRTAPGVTGVFDLLAVHPYWGTYRPILKLVGRQRGRGAFCFSSAAELGAYYLLQVGAD